MTHIVVLFANFGPYHVSRLKALHYHCISKGWKVTAIELARFEEEYPWQIDLKFLPFPLISLVSKPLEKTSFYEIIWELYRSLTRINPDVVAISGYARPTMIATLLWCLNKHKPAILFSETHEQDTKRFIWKEIPKRLLLKAYTAALVGGKPQKQYLEKLGMKPKSIFLGYNIVENQTFHPEKLQGLYRPIAQSYFLAINRFVPKKNLSYLISAYAEYRKIANVNAWDLIISGDGELRPQLEQQIHQLKLEEFVHLPGFLQQDQLLPYFAHAKCFVHASIQEQWGLVVNEAMAAGLPVLVSNRCGCYEDLIIEGVNGFGFDPEIPQQLTELMLKMSSEEIDLQRMGNAALEHIQQFSPDYFAQGLIQAIEHTVSDH